MKFGRFICIEFRGRNKRNDIQWLCRCSCGNEKVVAIKDMKSGNTSSCGCLKAEMLKERNHKHGLTIGSDGKKTRLFNIWMRMKQRCSDLNATDFERYGARGIRVDEVFMDYEFFHE